MRLFERALARTELPVRFSEGFNPRPKLSLPLPRPVGIATQADVLVVEFTQAVTCDQVVQQLTAQMPAGVKLEDAWIPQSSRPIQPETATYALELSTDNVHPVTEHLNELLAAESWLVHRDESVARAGKSLDLREQLVDARLEGTLLQWTVRIGGSGSVRPAEVLTVLGLDPGQWQHRVQRTAIAWRVDPARPQAG